MKIDYKFNNTESRSDIQRKKDSNLSQKAGINKKEKTYNKNPKPNISRVFFDSQAHTLTRQNPVHHDT